MHKYKIELKRKTRAYVRVSTKKTTQKDSPEHQRMTIEDFVLDEDDVIDKVYMDKATATSIMDREDVRQMIEDAKNGEFDTIIFVALSRFSRDTLDAIALKRTLVNALGIRLVSIEDFYDSAVEDNEMIFTMISSVNQKQSENTSKASKRGKSQSAKQGNFTGSIPPFGYRRIKKDGSKKLEIVSEKAEIVKKIFDLYLNHDIGEKNICLQLNEEGIKSPKGGLWGVTSVQRILQNENYTGHIVSGKYEKKEVYDDIEDMHNRRKKQVQKDEDEWYKHEEQTHEAIISIEDFEQAQQLRLIRGGGKRGGQRNYANIFAKFLYCDECGSAMVLVGTQRISAKTKKVKKYRYLLCSKNRRQGAMGCSNDKWFKYDPIKNKIINDIVTVTKEKIKLHSLSKSISEKANLVATNYEKRVKALDNQIAEARLLLFETRKMMLTKQLSKEQYEFEKAQYESEIAEAIKESDKLKLQGKKLKNIDGLIEEMNLSLNKLLDVKNTDNVMEVRRYLMKLIDRINLSTDGTATVYSVISFD